MKLNEAKYTRRFNMGDYEHEEYSLSCIAEEGDIAKELLTELKAEVLDAHTAEPKKQEKKEEEENGKSSSTKHNGKRTKSSAKSNEGVDDEGSKDDEAANTETDDGSDSEPETSEGSEDAEGSEGEEPEEKPAKGKSGKAPKEEKGKKAFKRKPQHYDRSIEQHKEIFSRVLKSIAPDWKKSEESKKKAKEVSEQVEGEPFLDENGEVLDGFKTKVRKLFK